MVTIRRHPVPADSYDPNHPLNDLLKAQFEHFQHIAKNLPPELRGAIPAEPSADDREGVDRFIAAVTHLHVSRKKELPRLVRPLRRKRPGTLAMVAAADQQPKRSKAAKSKSKAKKRRVAGPKR